MKRTKKDKDGKRKSSKATKDEAADLSHVPIYQPPPDPSHPKDSPIPFPAENPHDADSIDFFDYPSVNPKVAGVDNPLKEDNPYQDPNLYNNPDMDLYNPFPHPQSGIFIPPQGQQFASYPYNMNIPQSLPAYPQIKIRKKQQKLEKSNTLRSAIQKSSKLPNIENYNNTSRQLILIGIAHTMMILHKTRVIHRDLKPENILLDFDFHPFVSDVNRSHHNENLFYLAPEVLTSKEYSEKSDVYAFGIILYEVVTDKSPYPELLKEKDETKIKQFLIKKKNCPKFDKKVKESFQKLLQECLSNKPEERPTFEVIYNKLAYNIEDINKVDDGDEEAETEAEDDDKYLLPGVDKNVIEDYLNEIDNDNNTQNNFIIEAINERFNKIEKKIRKMKNNKKIFDKISEVEQGMKNQIAELNKIQNEFIENKEEKFLLLQKENDEIKEKFDSLQKEVSKLKKKAKKAKSRNESCTKTIKEQNEAYQQDNKKISDDIALIKIEIENLKKKEIESDEISDEKDDVDSLRDENIKLKSEVKKLKKRTSAETADTDLAERVSSVEKKIKLVNVVSNSAHSEVRSLRDDLKSVRDEIRKLKEKVSSFEIPDEIYENIKNVEDMATKTSFKYDKLRTENDRFNNELKSIKIEIRKLKDMPIGKTETLQIPDEIYNGIKDAQDLANQVNLKSNKLIAKSARLNFRIIEMEKEIKELKENQANKYDSDDDDDDDDIPEDILDRLITVEKKAHSANVKINAGINDINIIRDQNKKFDQELTGMKSEIKKLKSRILAES